MGNFERGLREKGAINSSQIAWLIGFVDCEPPKNDLATSHQFLSLTQLKDLTTTLERLHKLFRLEPLGSRGIEKVLEAVYPTQPLLRTVTAASSNMALGEIERETARYVPASESQIWAISQIEMAQRLSIIGGAGTGKSLIAAHMATTFADLGPDRSVLFIAHRKSAAANARVLLDVPIVPLTWEGLQSESIVVATESELTRLISKSESGISSNLVSAEEYFLSDHRKFDVLIIDEAQEFDKATIEALQFFLVDPDKSPVYLFADPYQFSGKRRKNLRRSYANATRNEEREYLKDPLVIVDSNEDSMPIPGESENSYSARKVNSRRFHLDWPADFAYSYHLKTNHRNSPFIGQFAFMFQPHDLPHFAVQEGVFNQFINLAELGGTKAVKRELRKKINELVGDVGGFLPCEILISDIGGSNKQPDIQGENWSTVSPDEILRYPLTRADRRVVRGNADQVQGLQAAAVIVIIHDKIGPPTSYEDTVKTLRDIYVASSRAMSNLIIMSEYSEDQLCAFEQLVPPNDGSWPSLADEWWPDVTEEKDL